MSWTLNTVDLTLTTFFRIWVHTPQPEMKEVECRRWRVGYRNDSPTLSRCDRNSWWRLPARPWSADCALQVAQSDGSWVWDGLGKNGWYLLVNHLIVQLPTDFTATTSSRMAEDRRWKAEKIGWHWSKGSRPPDVLSIRNCQLRSFWILLGDSILEELGAVKHGLISVLKDVIWETYGCVWK